MYVADVTSIEELEFLLAEVEDRLLVDPTNEQAMSLTGLWIGLPPDSS